VNNYPLGTNVHSILPELAVFLGCRAVLVSAVPAGADEEVLAWSVYDPSITFAQPVRSVGVRNTRGWWRFWRTGQALAFEDVRAYRARRLRRRFSFDYLVAYAAALDLRPFDASFYTPESSGAVVIQCGPRSPLR